MNDPYDEERMERVRSLQMMLPIFDHIRDRLRAATSAPPGTALELYDEALSDLFGLLDLCKPVAFRREEQGRVAFLWLTNAAQPTARFHWLVCDASGACRRGEEASQGKCEEVVERLLRA